MAKLDFEAADALLTKRGWTDRKDLWPDYFDDPAFSRYVLGLDNDWLETDKAKALGYTEPNAP